MANKMICGLGQLPITLIGMIAHGHGNEKYVQYSIELWNPCCSFFELCKKL
jgi:hypothetical protein